MVYYLKYRPQKLADLDLKEVRGGLARALSAREIPHAFLFVGPRGTGKTSAARIVAKAVNCKGKWKVESGKLDEEVGNLDNLKSKHPTSTSKKSPLAVLTSNPEPCNACDFCLSITAGTNLDILEIDAASNRGIDDVRSLKEKIRLAPSRAKYKVYIIDEAHMLTTEAFNALLKTLEEPPAHAIFILCTTEPQKLPATIVSRCLRFNFRKAKIEELVLGLEKIVKAEKLKVEKGALAEIAAAADGSFRDSQKMLEQLAHEKKTITRKMVSRAKGNIAGLEPDQLLHFLVAKDAGAAIEEIDRVVKGGVNLRMYTEGLMERLRLMLLAKIGVVSERLAATDDTDFVKAHAGKLAIEEIKGLIEIFARAASELKTTVIPQLPLEMGVVEYCENSKFQIRNSKRDKETQAEKKNPTLTVHPRPTTHNSSSPSFQDIENKWPEVLAAVGPKNHSIQAFLRATRPKELDGDTLILEVFYSFHKSQLESDKCRRVVEETVETIFEVPVKIKCVLGEKRQPEKYTMPLPVVEQAEDDTDDIMEIAEEIFGKPVD